MIIYTIFAFIYLFLGFYFFWNKYNAFKYFIIIAIIFIGWFSFYLISFLGIEHYIGKLVFGSFLSLIIYIQFVIKTQKDVILTMKER